MERDFENFYDISTRKLKDVEEHADRATGERLLGVDPKSGKNVYARMGRYGAMIQIGENDDEEVLSIDRIKSVKN